MKVRWFGLGAKKNLNEMPIYAPVDGDVVDLIKVPDPIFSQRTLGDGFAMEPTDGIIYSPVSGVVTMIASTQHAMGIRMDNGLDVMIHFGINTYTLNGDPFHIRVQHGQTIKAGRRIATVSMSRIRAADLNEMIVVTFSNSAERAAHFDIQYGPFLGGHRIGRVHAE